MSRILLAAEEGAGVRALKLLGESGHEVAGVLTASEAGGRSATVASTALGLKLPLLSARLLKDPAFADEVRALGIDVLLNVHSLYVIRAPILEAVRFGAFNLHPGPLPAYAGMNAPSWAILNGERRHGVTLHWMTAGIDEGAIAYQEMFDLDAGETGLSASVKCVSLGMKMIARLLEALTRAPESIPRQAQDLSLRKYFGRQTPFDGRPPLTLTAVELERLVRASDYHPFPSPWRQPCYRAGEREIGLLKVKPTAVAADEAPGTIRIQPDGAVWLAMSDVWVAVNRIVTDGQVRDPRGELSDGVRLCA